MKNLMIFMDGSNIMKSARYLGIKIDYIKLKDLLTKDRNLIRTFFFDGAPDPIPSSKQAFFDFLRLNEITVISKKVRKRNLNCINCSLGRYLQKRYKINFLNKIKSQILIYEEEYQKGVDVALVTELLRMARENVYDTAIVVSGDNDFSNAIECVKSMGKRVEVASFKNSLGYDIKQTADKLIFLDNYLNEIKKEKKQKLKNNKRSEINNNRLR